MKLSDIHVEREIEYLVKPGGSGHKKARVKTGIVKYVTPRCISVQGPKYPDTILVNDILSGQVEIIRLEGDESMGKTDWDILWPQVEDLLAEGKTPTEIAKELGIDNVARLRTKIHDMKKKGWISPLESASAKSEEVREAVKELKAKYGLTDVDEFTESQKEELSTLVQSKISAKVGQQAPAGQETAAKLDPAQVVQEPAMGNISEKLEAELNVDEPRLQFETDDTETNDHSKNRVDKLNRHMDSVKNIMIHVVSDPDNMKELKPDERLTIISSIIGLRVPA